MSWPQLLTALLEKLYEPSLLVRFYLPAVLLLAAWCIWWLCGVNWNKFWPTLAQGAWVPLLLVAILTALVWAQLQPSDCTCLGFMTLPNGWWQAGSIATLAALALGCGRLQGYFASTPPEYSVEPPPVAHDPHGHHGHH